MLRQLEEHEINQILRQNFKIWSPGLSEARYLHYQWWQFQTPWGRRNLKYWGLVEGREAVGGANEVTASCKLYDFSYQSKSQTYRAAGVGAVFVAEENRGRALGRSLLKLLSEHCTNAQYDFMILNSDIDPSYYEALGFDSFEPSAFRITLSKNWLDRAIADLSEICDPFLSESFKVRPVSLRDVEQMVRHHQRWLSAQPYGMMRSDEYLEFKLGRELYLKEHSTLGWPEMDIISVNEGGPVSGYALIEQAGLYLRVLEVIGSTPVRHSLWRQILKIAQLRGINVVRGWAKVAPDIKGLEYHWRDWSVPMIMPLKSEIRDRLLAWTEIWPPAFLELDHF